MKIYIIILIIFFSLRSFSNERYICNQSENSTSPLITNFYVINDKVIMSGASGSGEYKILNRTANGLLAINSSFIGAEFGLETILLNKRDKLFVYKTYINSKNNNRVAKVSGNCNLTD